MYNSKATNTASPKTKSIIKVKIEKKKNTFCNKPKYQKSKLNLLTQQN